MKVSKGEDTISGRLFKLFYDNGYDLEKDCHARRRLANDMKEKGLITETEMDKAIKSIGDHVRGCKIISSDWLNIYYKFFDCSADYILGFISNPTLERSTVYEATNLEDNAIKGLLALKETDDISKENNNPGYQLTEILNEILSLNNGQNFEKLMASIRQYLISDYLIPATHTKKGKPIFSESEYDYSSIMGTDLHYLTLHRSKEDMMDSVTIPITKELMETYAMDSLKKSLAEIKNELEKNKK